MASKKWIEAAKVLAVDPTAAVPCPQCGKDNLQVQDVKHDDKGRISRLLHCPTCKGHNEILMTWKPH